MSGLDYPENGKRGDLRSVCLIVKEGCNFMIRSFGGKNLQKDVSESGPDSRARFEQRGKHFWCGEPPISRMEGNLVSDDMILTIEPSERVTKADEPVDWRGEHFLWSAGGNCCA